MGPKIYYYVFCSSSCPAPRLVLILHHVLAISMEGTEREADGPRGEVIETLT